MTTLPTSSDFTGSTITEAQFKTAQTNLLSFLSVLLGSDGTVGTALSTIGALGGKIAAKSGAYTVLAADRGTVFHCSGTFTLTLTAAATLATGFSFSVINTSTGAITIDPNSTELIDGAATKILTAGQSCIVTCNGTAFFAISGGGGDADTVDGIHASATATANKLLACNASGVMPCSITGNAAGLSAALAIASGGTAATTASGAADNLSVVKRDHGGNNIGSFCMAAINDGIYGGLSINGTMAGSDLVRLKWDAIGSTPSSDGTLSGTWRVFNNLTAGSSSGGLWQRIT